NVQRADLNPIEEATGYQELIEKYGYTQEQVAEGIGKSRSHLANTLRLLKLPPAVRALVQESKLSAGHARALVGREDAEKLAQRIMDLNLTVRDVELLVQTGDGGGAGTGRAPSSGTRQPKEKDADTRAFEKDMSDALGLKVEIKAGSGESGVITVAYGNFEQLDYIRMRLVGPPAY
ncbi:MAG TPA: ParB/RepB/Spo0J family partition protein, partial [Hyphomicrobiaceae bacterium]|nr:ParB/RepB/Spo0J family partition protein [Hyphomicrobiaceae bacterium]